MTGNDAPHRRSVRGWSRTVWLVAFGAAAIAHTPPALASGFLNPRLADPHGHPAIANPYALYFNPGALGGQQGTQIVVDGTLAFRTVDFDRATSALSPNPPGSGLSDPLYAGANTGSAHASNVVGLPFVAASSDFGTRNFFAGIGVYVPFGGAVQFDQRPEYADRPDARGAVDGPQRWAIISGMHESIYSTLVLGYRLPDQGVSFGIGSSLVWTRIQHDEARNLDGSDNIASEGRALLDVSGVGVALSAGVYWDVLPKQKLRLGASYQVRPTLGRMRLSGTLRQYYVGESTSQVDLLQSYPDVIRLGLAARPRRDLEVRLDAEYVTWSLFGRQCIVAKGTECQLGPHGEDQLGTVVLAVARGWRDAAGVRAGLGYFVDPDSEIYGAVGYDTSAVPARTLEATYPDAQKVMASLGGRHQFTPVVALGASFTLVQYLTATTEQQDRSRLAGNSRLPNEDGTYDSRILFFNLNATFSF
jgi:long-chain fatty acid transport protein